MPDPFSTLTERRLAVLKVLAARGPLTIQQIAAKTGSSRHAVERVLNYEWFERLNSGRASLFGLTEAGREKASDCEST
ncbi:: DUF2161 [Gemmata massiliana]|uniref:: DUF2161 n=1 Tax=Gemmata massiliana TaxID=1210884 RepID=A0A6P2CZP0_9BACT|nr:HTH domain-containing protein [Gemmata massiliana]VTR94608.1 : DUF2161 [Gemmata massiliana]